MMDSAKIYCGEVHHKRLRPKRHKLHYTVFSILVNIDDLEDISSRSWLFGYNKPSFFSIYDKDFGYRDGMPISQYARQILSGTAMGALTHRISLLTYPRIMGYSFNPLSVYYCTGKDGQLCAIIYEVTNTFGDRHCYVLHPGIERHGVYIHSCEKKMYVSPFLSLKGQYNFRITFPSERLLVGVNFCDDQGPLIKTFFSANAKPFNDRILLNLAIGYPLMTLKVIAGIHFEAFRLWLKRIPLTKRPARPRFVISTRE
ncbi:MAG: hypothetical protein TECD_00662 [Hyphomicrobiaceae bacterium hypho_1]